MNINNIIKRKKIISLHIMSRDKFAPPYINFVNNNYYKKGHFFFVISGIDYIKIPETDNVIYFSKKSILRNIIKVYFLLFILFYKSKKIFLHGLFSKYIILFLFLNPWFLKKCYWIIWGGDLYNYQKPHLTFKFKVYKSFRAFCIKHFGYIVTFVKGDYELAKKWYRTKAKYYYAFYPNPVNYKYLDSLTIDNSANNIVIQVGNSADPTNKHLEIFEKLEKFKNKNIKIICPLSYGKQQYAKFVIDKGKKIFGNKFIPLMKFLPPEEYGKILNSVDVAIFNHDRQQALNNILSLLYLGKKVYIKNMITTWEFFKSKNIKIFNTYNLEKESFDSLIYIDEKDRMKNKKIIKEAFSQEKCVYYWKKIFEE